MIDINEDGVEVCDICGELLIECSCCPHCGGSGESDRNVPCMHCGGSGEYESPKPLGT